jgi:putative ABC transport system permease protein
MKTRVKKIGGVLAGFAALALLYAPSRAGDVVVERALADRAGIVRGDSVVVSLDGDRDRAARHRIVDFFEPPPDPSRLADTSRHVIMSLADVEDGLGEYDALTRIVLAVDPGYDAAVVADHLNRRAFGYRAFTASELATKSSEVFIVVSNFHKAISILSVLAGAVFLTAIVMLQVQELQKALGVLRLIGISRLKIFIVVVGETVILANLGSLFGVALAYAVSAFVNRFYQYYFDTALVFSSIRLAHVLLACGVSTLIGLVVGSLATGYLFKLRVTEVLGR